MSMFSQILKVFSFRANSEKILELNSKIKNLETLVESLSKTVKDQESMIHYLSTIQADLAAECFSLSDTIRKFTSPKHSTIKMFRIAASDDDDDLIN
jgi:signal-transduction protein with cAMP-binding, CBS, and nucleotidyltransferase domain